MKEEFKELYNYIIHSNDEEKMHVLGKVTKAMMCKLIENYPQQAREYLDMLQSVKWDNYLTMKEAEQIVINMTPQPAFSHSAWVAEMDSLGYPKSEEPSYNECALYVVMSMISSDSEETIKGMMNMMGVEMDKESMFKFIYRLALDKLLDKDKMFNVRTYFHIDS